MRSFMTNLELFILQLSFPQLALIAIASYFVLFLYIFFRIPQVPPEIAKRKAMEEAGLPAAATSPNLQDSSSINGESLPMDTDTELDTKGREPAKKETDGFLSLLMVVGQHFVDGVHTLVKKRPGKRRLFLVLMTFSMFFVMFAQAGIHGDVAISYMVNEPFKLDTADIATFQAIGSAVAICGTFLVLLF